MCVCVCVCVHACVCVCVCVCVMDPLHGRFAGNGSLLIDWVTWYQVLTWEDVCKLAWLLGDGWLDVTMFGNTLRPRNIRL